MLANAYLPAVVAKIGAVLSLFLAIALEVPILKLIWRRPLLRLAGWVVLANLASAAVGMVAMAKNAGPGVSADPWDVYQHWPQTFALYVSYLLALTLAVEGAVYLILNRFAAQRIPPGRLMAGLVVGHVISYGVLAGLMLWRTPSDESVEMLPDTAWLETGDARLWFVEPDTHHLNSIRLDGTDRRVEVDEPLARFQPFFDMSVYAVLPERRSIVYVGADLKWRVSEAGETRRLGVKVEPDERGFVQCSEATASLPRALAALDTTGEADDGAVGAVWTCADCRSRQSVMMTDEVGPYRVETMLAGGGRSGFGLFVTGPQESIDFGIPAGPAYLACTEPFILPDPKLVVFRCSAWIMVMDIESQRAGRLVEGDSIVAVAPAFNWGVEQSKNRSRDSIPAS